MIYIKKSKIIAICLIFIIFTSFSYIKVDLDYVSSQYNKKFLDLDNSYSSIFSSLYLWNRTWGGPEHDAAWSIAIDSNNDIYVAGFTNTDALLIKYNSTGHLIWNQSLAGRGVVFDIAFDSLNNIYLTSGTRREIFTIKYSRNGDLQWEKMWDGRESYNDFSGIALDSNDNIYVAGTSFSPTDMFLLKYNNSGDLQWEKWWDGGGSDSCYALAIDSEDNLYMGGQTSSFGAAWDLILIKFNNSGDEMWYQLWGGDEGDACTSISVDLNDNLYLGGYTKSFSADERDICLLKYSKSGDFQWETILGMNGEEYCYDIALDSKKNIYMTGRDGTITQSDNLLAKFDNEGNKVWNFTWGDPSDGRDCCLGIAIDSDNYIYTAGRFQTGPFMDRHEEVILYKFQPPPPIFSITSPLSNQLIGTKPPYFELNFLETDINTTWYTLNDGENHIISGTSGYIDSNAWENCPNGTINIKFYANNSLGLIMVDQVNVQKDSIAPIINLNLIKVNRLYGNLSPSFEMVAIDNNLDSMWYTLDNGLNNHSFINSWESINQVAWDSCLNGTVNIIFYANDTVGNIASEIIKVYKDINAPYIEVIKPELFLLYGKILSYEITKYGDNIESTWYTINDGPKHGFSGSFGDFNQNLWNSTSDGIVLLKFFINDSFSREVCCEVKIFKDATDPNILINLPLVGEFFGINSPNYEVNITDVNLNSKWYTLDGGLTNFTISNNIGVINQSAWSSLGEGNVSIRFYAKDLTNNTTYKDIVVQKDTISPSIKIESPLPNELFLYKIPEFNVSISDPNLNETWYTLNSGLEVYFNGSFGSIAQQVWELCSDGNVNITFYANDFAGNVNHENVIVRKNIDSKEAYAIIIGISNYPDSNNDLNYCDDDAIAVYNMLINDYNFKPANIIYLQDSSATKADINNAFDSISSLSDPNDVFFFYYSGHGGQGTFTTQGNWNVETLHPYWNNYDQIWSVSHPGALYMRVHFERFETEDFYDYALCGNWGVTQGFYYEELTGNLGYNFWSSYIPVSSYYIRFISDGSNPFPYYGFKIDKYEAILPDGTHYLCSYDSIPSNPGAYYMDTLLDSKLDSINCADKYVIVDACNSGGLIPEVEDIGRYIMTACGANEESLETSLLEHGIFTYFLLESKDNANDENGDGVISMEESYSYVYSNTRSYSGSFGSEYRYSPQESDGISGEAVLYPSVGSVWINPIGNQLSYSFHLYGHGLLKTLNLTVCSISPTITLKTQEIKNLTSSPTGFGYYNGTIELPDGYIAGGIQLLAEIEGNSLILINISVGDSDGDGLTDIFEILEGLNPNSNDTDSDGLLDGEEINVYDTNPLLDDTDFDGLTDYDEIIIYSTDPLLDDTDSDGLLDGDEINIHFTDPLLDDTDSDELTDGDEINIHFTDPLNNDTDSDNLTDSEEILTYYTDPLIPDTDFDGLTDYDEITIYSTDPLLDDTDSDGLLDGEEINLYDTDPLLDDTDFDGLSDYEEVVTHNTNPLNDDTDLDTIPDGWEVDNLLDPLINDTALDPDNDLLTNLGEYQFGTQPFNNDTDSDGLLDGEEVYMYNTEPLQEDTDSDGLLDGEEVNTYSTEPLEEDTDSDGLLDGEEVYDFNTNPLSGDTDSDTMPDGWEVNNLLNPLVNDTASDPDNDLLINILEYQHNTDPQNPDTDGDSWTDGDEVLEYDTDPLDPDDHPIRKGSPAIPGYSISLLISIISLVTLILIKKFRKYSPIT